MSKKALSLELQAQLDRLATLPDDTIDTSDFPELPDEVWAHARRPGLCDLRDGTTPRGPFSGDKPTGSDTGRTRNSRA